MKWRWQYQKYTKLGRHENKIKYNSTAVSQ